MKNTECLIKNAQDLDLAVAYFLLEDSFST